MLALSRHYYLYMASCRIYNFSGSWLTVTYLATRASLWPTVPTILDTSHTYNMPPYFFWRQVVGHFTLLTLDLNDKQRLLPGPIHHGSSNLVHDCTLRPV